jgi:hypothetical protein
MPLATKEYHVSDTTFELLPGGIYECKLVDLADRVIVNKQTNEEFDRIEWIFEILSGPHKGKQITDLCSPPTNGLGPKTKMRQWIEGMTGTSLAGRTKPVDPNKLIGRECYVTLFRGLNQAGREVNKIQALSPKNSTSVPEPVAPPPTQDNGANLFD